ncbi:MAG: hypothetical protein J0G29_01070 [Alphaproteobacteria bacterium]|nr:hypothetical protein [Alphaproteobacteria bacterium]OJV47154.1 MAG: hypothetical protein BGO28_01800 [Alphaproteobacteria bacterium 43-37]
MKKKLLMAIFVFSVSSLAKGNSIEQQILFCTKNLTDPSFYPALSRPPVAAGHAHPEKLDAYDTLNHGQHSSVVDLRHCFMALATVNRKGNGVVTLSELQTRGYGQLPNPEPGQKTGGTYEEWWSGNEVVGCVSVLTVSEEQIIDEGIWSKVTGHMKKAARQQDYDPADHNCCTVAYGAAKHIGGDLSQINPTSFNFLGVGVAWKGSDLMTAKGLTNKVSVWAGVSYDFSAKSILESPKSPSRDAEDKGEL